MLFSEILAKTSRSNQALIIECFFRNHFKNEELSFCFEEKKSALLFVVNNGSRDIARGALIIDFKEFAYDKLFGFERKEGRLYMFCNALMYDAYATSTFFPIEGLKIPSIDWSFFDPSIEYTLETLPKAGSYCNEILSESRIFFTQKDSGAIELFSAFDSIPIVLSLKEEIFNNKNVVILVPTIRGFNDYVSSFLKNNITCGAVIKEKDIENKEVRILKTSKQIQEFIKNNTGSVTLVYLPLADRLVRVKKEHQNKIDFLIFDRCDYFFHPEIFGSKSIELEKLANIQAKKKLYLHSTFFKKEEVNNIPSFFSYSYKDAIKEKVLDKFDILIRIEQKPDDAENFESSEGYRIDKSIEVLNNTLALFDQKHKRALAIGVKNNERKMLKSDASKVVAFLKPTKNKTEFRNTLKNKLGDEAHHYVLDVNQDECNQMLESFNKESNKSILYAERTDFMETNQVDADVFYFGEEFVDVKKDIGGLFKQICQKSTRKKCCVFTIPICVKDDQRILITKKVQKNIDDIFSLLNYFVECSGNTAMLNEVAFLQSEEELNNPSIKKIMDKIQDDFFDTLSIGNTNNTSEKKDAEFIPLYDKSGESIFKYSSYGILSHRDVWVWANSKNELETLMRGAIQIYNESLKKGECIEGAISLNDKKIDFLWSSPLKKSLANGIQANDFDPSKIRIGYHRPFIEKYCYFDKFWIDQIGLNPMIFPEDDAENLILVFDKNSLRTCVCDTFVNSHFYRTTSIYPLYMLNKQGERECSISQNTLELFRKRYSNNQISVENIFCYVFAVLQNGEFFYNQKYSIPLLDEFYKYVDYGKKLIDLYLGKVKVAKNPEVKIENTQNPHFEINELKIDKQKRRIVYNETITISNIPLCFFRSSRNSRSLAYLFYKNYSNTQGKSGFLKGKDIYNHLLDTIYTAQQIEECINAIKSLNKK